MRFHYIIELFSFGIFGFGLEFGGIFGTFFGGFATSGTVFLLLIVVMDAIDETTDTNDEHVGTEEADEGRDFEVARVKNDEAHYCATNANRDTNEAVGLVFAVDNAVGDVDDTGNDRVDCEHYGDISDIFVSEDNKAERSNHVNK